jgi:molybdenum cofactor guanylyltransferase
MGRDKWSLPWGDETLLTRTIRILAEVVQPVVAVAAEGQPISGLPPETILVRDRFTSQGPLAGLHAGLGALRERASSTIEAAYLSACDTPLLKPDFVRGVIDRLDRHELAVPREGKYHHPLAGVYRLSLADRIAGLLAAERNRPLFLIEQSDCREIDVEELRGADPDLDSLRNCNTPEEYASALLKSRLAEIPLAARDRSSS